MKARHGRSRKSFIVSLRVDEEDLFVEAWSFGLKLETDGIGASLRDLQVEGTAAAEFSTNRYSELETLGDTAAFSATILNLLVPTPLPADERVSILRGALRFTVPSEGEGTVTLAPAEAVRTAGQVVAVEIVGVRGFTPIVEPLTLVARPARFVRGDANQDRRTDIADPIFILRSLFLGELQPVCGDAADANDDNKRDISDAGFMLGCLFLGEDCPVDPFPGCGVDLTVDAVGCENDGICP